MAEPVGFFTDTTVCIGCKACEVACKEWNQLPAADGGATTLSGDSYDNTRRLDGLHWVLLLLLVSFVVQALRAARADATLRSGSKRAAGRGRGGDVR